MIIMKDHQRIHNFPKENLCIVTDFDKTITSNESVSSIGVFSNFFPKQYAEEKSKIMEQEEKIFLSKDISNVQKEQLLHSIWIKKLKLLKEFLNNCKVINDIVSSNQFIFRDDAIETINYLQRKYQVIINSSGFGNLIIELLKKEGCHFDNLVVFSNFIQNGMIDFSKMIDPYRKYNTEYIKYINNYKNFVLLGDSLTDLNMLPLDLNKISVGFLDCEYDTYLKDFTSDFDIVATENEPYSSPVKKLSL